MPYLFNSESVILDTFIYSTGVVPINTLSRDTITLQVSTAHSSSGIFQLIDRRGFEKNRKTLILPIRNQTTPSVFSVAYRSTNWKDAKDSIFEACNESFNGNYIFKNLFFVHAFFLGVEIDNGSITTVKNSFSMESNTIEFETQEI